jgi:hypothetical protein
MGARDLLMMALSGAILAACTSTEAPSLSADDMTVYFSSQSASLVSSEREKLDRVAAALIGAPDVRITIAGFAGSPGDPPMEMDLLARARVLTVLEALVSDFKREHVERVGFSYWSCAISESPLPHRVDIYVTGAEASVTDPCSAEGEQGGSAKTSAS